MDINRPISITIIIIVVIVFGFLFAWPKYKESNGLDDVIVKKQAEYSGKSAYYKKISDALNSLQVQEAQIKKIESALPQMPSVASLVYFLDTKASEKGMVVKSISVSPQTSLQAPAKQPKPSEPSAVKDINFSLDLAGSYVGLKSFLKSLEESSRLFEVGNISFASVGAGSEVQAKKQLGTYNFKMNLKIYTY